MEINNCINFLLSASQNAVFQYFAKQLSKFNITPAQYGVLSCLWHFKELSPKKLGEMLYLETSSVSGILDRMQKNGWIERNIDPNNRRAILVSLTQKALDIQEDVETVVDEMNAKFLASFSFEEQTALKSALNHIINLDTQK
jgi:DNA-binding MarR family transcriptional regulator